MKKFLLVILFLGLTISSAFSQGSPDYNGGMKVKLNDDGSKYFRIISWIQGQGIYNFDVPEDVNNVSLKIRRARVLMYSQITDKFMIVTHVGLNSLTANNMTPVGTGKASQIFLHGAWAQYNVAKHHTVGMGLHYFNGISRLNNQSSLNMLTLDNNRQSWATIGLSDQFARHLGVFAKGNFGKLQYRVAINDALTNSLDTRDTLRLTDQAIYAGKRILGSKKAGFNYAGYFEYNFLDQESNFLPYKVGTYLGSKRVFNIGAGFFYHPYGSVIYDENTHKYNGEDVVIFAIDTYYEAPLAGNNDAITFYATYQNNNYGTNYKYLAYGTGNMFYSHLGYLFGGDITKPRIQPYVSYGLNTYEADVDNNSNYGIGTNIYFSGHNSKITVEYKNNSLGDIITVQAMIYL